MDVNNKMIDKGLRRRGAVMRRFLAARSEESHRKGSPLIEALKPILTRPPKYLRFEEEWIPRPDGTRLRMLIYRPLQARPDAPGLLWLHGGGYVSGLPEMETLLFRSFIEGSGCVVVTPDYRLGTEAPYPAALEDSYAALVWLKENAVRLGVRDNQIAVGGASAGGGMTAAVTLYARDRGEVAVAFQMPIYPMIDDRPTSDHATNNNAPVWDSITNRSAWKIYLGDLDGTDDVPAYAAPARATNYAGLPPTMTFVGDLEPFRDETVRYVENLRAASVPVEFKVFPGAYHGFDGLVPGAPISRAALAFRDQWFGYAVRTYFAAQPTTGRSARPRL